MKNILNEHALKYFLGFALVFAIRLLPFRPPNVEPLMATLMPFSKRYGGPGAFLFGFMAIVLFDAVTSGIGMWTWITAVAYGLVGVGGALFFQSRASTAGNYVVYAVAATLVYDAVTGLSVGPLFFGQPFTAALVGQIPFTAMHLAGNIVLAAVLSPAVYQFVVNNPRLKIGLVPTHKAA